MPILTWFRTFIGHTKSLIMILYTLIRTSIIISNNEPDTESYSKTFFWDFTKQRRSKFRQRSSKLRRSKSYYKEARNGDGYDKTSLSYSLKKSKKMKLNKDKKKKKKRKKCKCKTIWFNPSFSLNIKTNVGKIFLKLLKRHFQNGNTLHKIFNCNTVKMTYCCMKNKDSIICSHNKKIVQPNDKNFGCNCRIKREFPPWEQMPYT